MSEELKVGDRVDVILDYSKGEPKRLENFGFVKRIKRLYCIEDDKGNYSIYYDINVSKHVPQPKPGDLVRSRSRGNTNPWLFINRICTSDGKAYWACEYENFNGEKQIILNQEEYMELFTMEEK